MTVMLQPQLQLEIQDLHASYGRTAVLRGITLAVARGERIVICGPSGSGKSTLLRCMNGLATHERGRVIVEGVELRDDHMKKKYFEQDKFPSAKIVRAEGSQGRFTGTLEVHGVAKPISGTYELSNGLVKAKFHTKMSEFAIAWCDEALRELKERN